MFWKKSSRKRQKDAEREFEIVSLLQEARRCKQEENYQKALEFYNQAIEMDPDPQDGYSYFLRGMLLVEGLFFADKQAIADLERAMELGLGHDDKMMANFLLGRLNRDQEDLQDYWKKRQDIASKNKRT